MCGVVGFNRLDHKLPHFEGIGFRPFIDLPTNCFRAWGLVSSATKAQVFSFKLSLFNHEPDGSMHLYSIYLGLKVPVEEPIES